MNNKKIPIKAYLPSELARLYNVSHSTFNKWLKPFRDELGPRAGYFYNPYQVRIIFEKLELPGDDADDSQQVE